MADKRRKNRKTRKLRIDRVLIAGLLAVVTIFAVSRALTMFGTNEETSKSVSNNQGFLGIPEKKVEKVSIAAVGDVMYHSPQFLSSKKSDGSYDFDPNYMHVKDIISQKDVSFANFETVTAKNKKPIGYPTFNSPPETITALKNAGFDILSTANNHSFDQGSQGIVDTLDRIEENGLKAIGTRKSQQDEMKRIIEVNNIKIGLLCYTYGSNIPAKDLDAQLSIYQEERMKTDAAQLKEQGAEVLIAYMHWGNEYEPVQNENQKMIADQFFQADVDVVLGSHPHVIQPAEWKTVNEKNRYVIYSMGNFVSNQRSEIMGTSKTENGVIVTFDLEKSKEGKVEIKEVNPIPTWVYKQNAVSLNQYQIIPLTQEYVEDNKLNLSESVLSTMKKSREDTLRVINSTASNPS